MSATKEYYHDQIEAGQRGKQHKISWLNMPGYKPETWNPIVGCNKVSPGCDNCYAEKFAFRIVNMTEKSKSETHHVYRNAVTKSGWTGRTALNTDHIDKPLQWKTPRMVFVCSMGDLFHENVPFRWIDRVFDVINQCPQHIFILLTKRPENMVNYLTYNLGSFSNISSKPDGNTWWGVTAENQEQANRRISILLQIPAAKRFVSIEPMLGPIDFYDIVCGMEYYHSLKGFGDISGGDFGKFNGPKLDWVICGGESGSKARPMHPDWVRSVRDQCQAANVPFFFKQWGEWTSEYPQDKNLGNMNQTYQHDKVFYKVGRKTAGDLLDGKEYHEWPLLQTHFDTLRYSVSAAPIKAPVPEREAVEGQNCNF